VRGVGSEVGLFALLAVAHGLAGRLPLQVMLCVMMTMTMNVQPAELSSWSLLLPAGVS
jgi:hypothetical protein